MSSIPSLSDVNRRNFLSVSGLAGIGVATAHVEGKSLLGGIETGTMSGTKSVKLGVILPKSDSMVEQGYLTGLQHYFNRNNTSVQLVPLPSRATYYGVQESVVKLVTEEDVKWVTGLFNPTSVTGFEAILESKGATLVAASAGENLTRGEQTSATVIQHSLLSWQSNRMLGQWAAQILGKRGVIISSLHDSGYDALSAFELGFTEAGGQFIQTHITHAQNQATDQVGIQNALSSLPTSQPDFVFASYHSWRAIEFIRAYTNYSGARKLPLLGSSSLTDNETLAQLGQQATRIRTVQPWAGNTLNETGKQFLSQYQSQYSGSPDKVTLLGFETGALLNELIQTGSKPAQLAGPFRNLALDAQANTTTSPLYLCEVKQVGEQFQNVAISRFGVASVSDTAIKQIQSSLKSGWLKPSLLD